MPADTQSATQRMMALAMEIEEEHELERRAASVRVEEMSQRLSAAEADRLQHQMATLRLEENADAPGKGNMWELLRQASEARTLPQKQEVMRELEADLKKRPSQAQHFDKESGWFPIHWLLGKVDPTVVSHGLSLIHI